MKGCIKVWAPVAVFVAILLTAIGVQFHSMIACEVDGGHWIGGVTRTAFCAEPRQ